MLKIMGNFVQKFTGRFIGNHWIIYFIKYHNDNLASVSFDNIIIQNM